MDRPLHEAVSMFECAVCHAEEGREEVVDEVFHVHGQYILASGIPAIVCARCGEQVFSRETAEKVRLAVHGKTRSRISVPMQVFDFAQ